MASFLDASTLHPFFVLSFFIFLFSLSFRFLLLSLLSFVTLTRVTADHEKRKQLEGKEHGKYCKYNAWSQILHKVICCSVSFCTEVPKKKCLSQTKGRNQNNQSKGARAQPAITITSLSGWEAWEQGCAIIRLLHNCAVVPLSCAIVYSVIQYIATCVCYCT